MVKTTIDFWITRDSDSIELEVWSKKPIRASKTGKQIFWLANQTQYGALKNRICSGRTTSTQETLAQTLGFSCTKIKQGQCKKITLQLVVK